MPGQRLGYVQYLPCIPLPQMPMLRVSQVEIVMEADCLNLMPDLLLALWEKAQAMFRSGKLPCHEVLGLELALERDHSMYHAIPNDMVREVMAAPWYIRIPDMVAFLRRIRPALELNLAGTVAEGYSGEVRLNFFRFGLKIDFERGRILSIDRWRPGGVCEGDARFPEASFLRLVCGWHRFSELSEIFADCWGTHRAVALLDQLLPSFHGNVRPLAWEEESAGAARHDGPGRHPHHPMNILHTITCLLARPYRQKRPPSKKVAILVPLSTRPALTGDEKISLRHLEHYLGNYDRYLIAPPGSPIRIEGFRIMNFARKFFGSVVASNHLLYDPGFFEAFKDYRHIFIYHLDSLVFSDQMEKWCQTDLDYIGAPWIPCPDAPWVTEARVGNTGFGMMKVESALKVLYNRYQRHPGTYWLDMFTRNSRRVSPLVRIMRTLQPRFPGFKIMNTLLAEWDEMQDPAPHGRACDIFWSDQAVAYLPEYKVATLDQGLEFAFELAPQKCFEMNGGKMPFGCHAWARYDRGFWEPHLLPLGSDGENRFAPG